MGEELGLKQEGQKREHKKETVKLPNNNRLIIYNMEIELVEN